MGRVTTGLYKGVHEDGEPLRNAAMVSAVVFKTASYVASAGLESAPVHPGYANPHPCTLEAKVGSPSSAQPTDGNL